jgi:hypothetical protein
MWNQFRKYSPFAAIVGYLFVYLNKGWDKMLTDIESITLEKLYSRWQYIAVAIAAGAVLYVINRMKLPVPLRTFLFLLLYFVIGYNIGKAIDPPNGNGNDSKKVMGWQIARNPGRV